MDIETNIVALHGPNEAGLPLRLIRFANIIAAMRRQPPVNAGPH
jgi:hypothetical protein